MNDDDLRDCFAMFAMAGIIMSSFDDTIEVVAKDAYRMADAMLEARKTNDDGGITSVAKRSYRRRVKDE